MEDQLILVDVFDRQTGTASKLETHENGLLHRAFSVFLVNGRRMLIQQRAFGKYHSGGLWANACCSHPRAGETLADAVVRRTAQELGVEISDVVPQGSFVYRHAFSTGLVEYEYDHVFLGSCGAQLQPDPDEINALEWVTLDWLARDLVARPQRYAAWFLTAAPMVLRHLG